MPSEDDSNTDKSPQVANESGRKTKTGKLSGLNRGTAGAKNVACQEQRRTRRVLAPREEKELSDNSGNFLTDDDEVTQQEEEDAIAEHANRRHTGGLSGLSRGTAGVKNVACQEQRRTRGELAPRGEKESSDNSGNEVTQHEEDNTVEEYSIRPKRGKKLSEIVRGKSRQVSDVTATEEDDEEFYAQRFLPGKQKDSCSSKTGKAVRNNNNKTVRFHELNVVSDNEEFMSDDDFGGPPESNKGKAFYKDILASERVQRDNRSKVQVGRAVEQFNVLPQRRTSTASAVTRCKASKQSRVILFDSDDNDVDNVDTGASQSRQRRRTQERRYFSPSKYLLQESLDTRQQKPVSNMSQSWHDDTFYRTGGIQSDESRSNRIERFSGNQAGNSRQPGMQKNSDSSDYHSKDSGNFRKYGSRISSDSLDYRGEDTGKFYKYNRQDDTDGSDRYREARQDSGFESHRNRVTSRRDDNRCAKLENATQCRGSGKNFMQFISDDEFFDDCSDNDANYDCVKNKSRLRGNSARRFSVPSGRQESDARSRPYYSVNDDDSELDRKQVSDRRRSSTNNRKSIQPDKFDGVGNTDLIGFLDHFEACAEYNSWSVQEMAVQLRLCLRSKAARAVHTEDGARLSYKEMVARLKRRFGVSGQEIRCRNELRTRKRHNNESIQDIADVIITLLESAYPTMDICVLGIEFFLEALNDDELVTRIRDHSPRDFESAVSMAIQFESYSKPKVVTESISRPRYEGRVRAIQSASEESQVMAATQLETRPSIKCGNCGKAHPTARCWARGGANSHNAPYRVRQQEMTQQSAEVSAPVVASRSDARPRLDRSVIRCFLCDEFGHLKHECPLFSAVANLKAAKSASNTFQVQTEVRPPSTVNNNSTVNAVFSDVNSTVSEDVVLVENSTIEQLDDVGIDILFIDRSSDVLPRENKVLDIPNEAVESFDQAIKCPGYLSMQYEGRSYAVLLDSGCDLSVFPAKMITRQDLSPFSRNTIAANGSVIKILGETVIELQLDDIILLARVLVSPNVMEPMLSRQWMRFNDIVWNYAQDFVTLRGKAVYSGGETADYDRPQSSRRGGDCHTAALSNRGKRTSRVL